MKHPKIKTLHVWEAKHAQRQEFKNRIGDKVEFVTVIDIQRAQEYKRNSNTPHVREDKHYRPRCHTGTLRDVYMVQFNDVDTNMAEVVTDNSPQTIMQIPLDLVRF